MRITLDSTEEFVTLKGAWERDPATDGKVFYFVARIASYPEELDEDREMEGDES